MNEIEREISDFEEEICLKQEYIDEGYKHQLEKTRRKTKQLPKSDSYK